MAAGQEVLIQDLPAELFEATAPESSTGHALPDSWATLLAQWADRALRSGHQICCLKLSQRWSVRC